MGKVRQINERGKLLSILTDGAVGSPPTFRGLDRVREVPSSAGVWTRARLSSHTSSCSLLGRFGPSAFCVAALSLGKGLETP
jgi:hypothetical protein